MIKENVARILKDIPKTVELVGAAKTRSSSEMLEALEGGLHIIGHNYVKEAELAFQAIGDRAKWHMIGHLQSNKAKKAVALFDMIETVDSFKLAKAIDKASLKHAKSMPILIEINSAEEGQKPGVLPINTISLVEKISQLKNIKIMGLMTMGPATSNQEDCRPYFSRVCRLFEELKRKDNKAFEMRYLSMGMSSSYQVAIEEGANIIRLGTKLFGPRAQIKTGV